MPLIRIRDLKNGTITEAKYNGHFDKGYVVRKGDLLIGMDGEFACYEWRGEEGLLNQRVCKLHSFSHQVHPRFLLLGINSYLKKIEDATSYTTVKHLSSKQILDIEMAIPPLREQERIVTILDQAFAGIAVAKANASANARESLRVFDLHRRSVFAWLAVKPGKPLIQFASFRNGVNFTKGSKGQRVRIVGVRDFQDRFTVPTKDLDSVTIDGEINHEDVLAPGDTLHSGFTIRTRLLSDEVSPRYLCHFMRSSATRRLLIDGGTGTNIKSLSQASLAKLVLPKPSLDEQNAVVDNLDELSRESERLQSVYQQKLAAFEALKQSFLHQAFSGKL